MKKTIHVLMVSLLVSGCVTIPSPSSGNLGKSGYRNVVILGEHINREIAQDYANKYDARVLYTQGRGFLANTVSNSFRGTLGPSRAMRDIVNELKSINNTEGMWKLIIPPLAEKYFLVTLRNMEDNSILNAHGQVVLQESSANEEIKQEVVRVFGNNFEVIYQLP